MSILVDEYLENLNNIEKGYCWYLVKQDTTFWKQCYFVSILEEYKTQNSNLNFEEFFKIKIDELNKLGLNLIPNHRALRIAYFYGLLDDPARKYSNYSKANATPVYFEILKRTGGSFEKVELYKDIIQSQIEKMYISSIIDEKNETTREDFKLYPILFLYKILLELGYTTGKFELSYDEYKFFVITQPRYECFLDCLFLIKESRLNKEILISARGYKDKLDSRFNLTLNELATLDIDDNKISLEPNSIQYVSDLIHFYENNKFPEEKDYINFLTSNRAINPFLQKLKKEDTVIYKDKLVSDFPLSKPFLLLAGVSGTGKSRFVRQQAEKTGEFQLVAVRPDWHEPSDLLGYVSRLSGKAEYVMTDVLKFIVKAWQAVENAGVIANGEVSGSLGQLADVPPFWLCLDEMNLAPVEQYFADYLAVLETREWKWIGDEFSYKTEALLSATAWADIVDLKKELNVSETLWDFFQKNGIGIPFNLIVAGTVNMDETTHAFSRKVLDRALSFDFSKFYPNDFAAFFEPKTQPKLLGYPIYSQATEDDNSAKSITFLTALNEKLKETPFELAYRALNELLLSVVSFQPQDDRALQAVWDDFVMTKVLPRIEGDENKVGSVLDDLKAVLKNELGEIWDNPRPDLWRENVDGSELEIDCRCKPKLERMQKQFTERGMVSFW